MATDLDSSVPAGPRTAAEALVGFARELTAALLLRPALYARAVSDRGAWRRAAVVVILGALGADSIGLYSHLDEFLVVLLANWSLIPIMLIALARWAVACAVAFGFCRLLGARTDYGALLRPAGYAHAPAVLQFLPTIAYWLDIAPVTRDMLEAVRWLTLPWLWAALTLAAMHAGVRPLPRAAATALVLFVSANLFDLVLDELLLAAIGLGGEPVPAMSPEN